MFSAIQQFGRGLTIVAALCAIFISQATCRQEPTQQNQTLNRSRSTSPDQIWTRIDDREDPSKSVVDVRPSAFASYKLDIAKLGTLLQQLHLTVANQPASQEIVMTFPLPDGSYGRFAVKESSIMEPVLAQRFPDINAFEARGLDDPTARGRFEISPEGLHAMFLASAGTFLVDPLQRTSDTTYISYFHKSLGPDPTPSECLAKEYYRTGARHRVNTATRPSGSGGDGQLRTYRLAVAATNGYVEAIHKFVNPTGTSDDLVIDAFTAIHRTINRVNLIYQTEFGIRLVLVAKEAEIIYADPATDPYASETDHDELLKKNQTNLDAKILSANYDVGHLFTAMRGGAGAQPCACSNSFKGWGVSGRERPFGNAFDVNLVSHEIGHQFNASHSFNGTTKGCEYRNPPTAYEPGSGSTIMSYASDRFICGNETIQALSDPYFHAISLQEINGYVTSRAEGDSCAQKTSTSNFHSPIVKAPDNYVVPMGTAFSLRAVSGTDGDSDTLVYNWEEFDLGEPDPPDPTVRGDEEKIRPLFRSMPWSTDTARTFPALKHLMTPPAIYVAEALPLINRTMNFRVTARDNRGRYGFDDVRVRILAKQGALAFGPFEVVDPGVGVVWHRGSTQTVKWEVANTNLSPIGCSSVKISLIVRGDESHPILLAATAPNNGSAQIDLPSDLPVTSAARIKIEAVGNIFLAVSKSDIQTVE